MIVCLGWGSLIWHPDTLPVLGEWQNDGPALPIEFVRQSNNGRLTLVLDEQSAPLPVYWATLDVGDLDDGVRELAKRERCHLNRIGRWPYDVPQLGGGAVETWAKAKGIEGVVWTALNSKFDDELGKRPNQLEALSYLRNLSGEALSLAEEYIRKTPAQIRTPYREAFELELGWTPLD